MAQMPVSATAVRKPNLTLGLRVTRCTASAMGLCRTEQNSPSIACTTVAFDDTSKAMSEPQLCLNSKEQYEAKYKLLYALLVMESTPAHEQCSTSMNLCHSTRFAFAAHRLSICGHCDHAWRKLSLMEGIWKWICNKTHTRLQHHDQNVPLGCSTIESNTDLDRGSAGNCTGNGVHALLQQPLVAQGCRPPNSKGAGCRCPPCREGYDAATGHQKSCGGHEALLQLSVPHHAHGVQCCCLVLHRR